MTNFTQVKGTRKQTWQILNTLLSRKSKEPTLIKNLKINPDNEIPMKFPIIEIPILQI